MTALLAFVAVSVVVICTPGPDTVLTVRNAVAGGRRGGLFTAVGVACGQAVWTVAASVGTAAVLQSSATAFRIVQLGGAAYLVVLGVQSLLGAWRVRGHTPTDLRRESGVAPARAFRQGLISNLANPRWRRSSSACCHSSFQAARAVSPPRSCSGCCSA